MVSTYTILLSVHLLAAVLWVGGGATLHLMGRIALASGDRSQMHAFYKSTEAIGPKFYAPLSLVLLIAGIFLVDEAGYSMSDLWVVLAMIGWVTSFLIGIGYYSRMGKRQDEVVASGGLEGKEFLANYRQIMQVNVFELTILLLIVVDMAIKP